MRISELSARTEVPVGTIKYYLREGLLAPGRQTSRTTAEYDEAHVERVRLVRALTDAGGLGIATVHRITAVLDAPEPARLDLLAAAQDALLRQETLGTGTPGRPAARENSPGEDAETDTGPCAGPGEERDPGSRAGDWVRRRGWTDLPDDLLVARLERVWQACEQAGIELDGDQLDGYAEAMEHVARLDVDSVPEEADAAVHRVVVGTVMLEPVLLTLRMLAQRELSLQRGRARDATGGRRAADGPLPDRAEETSG
jgi:DNA-binding transcriptional MerR regulator